MERDEEGGCQWDGGTNFMCGKKQEEEPKDWGRREEEQSSANTGRRRAAENVRIEATEERCRS